MPLPTINAVNQPQTGICDEVPRDCHQEDFLKQTTAHGTPRKIPQHAPPRAYCWDADVLSSFTSLMSAHGSPVCASLMLGDAEYARGQLRLACTLDHRVLQQIAVQMLGGFTHPNPTEMVWSSLHPDGRKST